LTAFATRRAVRDRPAFGNPAVTRRFSAYLSIYNDWEILGLTLPSIAPWIDELVIVDGAYRWMVPFLQAIGVDPERSDPRVLQATADLNIPVKVVNGLWDDEIAKRTAGYNACAHRYIFRLDADEYITFHDAELDAFLAGGHAAAAMEMPLFVAPGWFRAQSMNAPIERQGLLFDGKKISAQAHLRYLWLVLGKQDLPATNDNLPMPFERPIAFNAHLSTWRTPATSITRAMFYQLNYFRHHGFSWMTDAHDAPVTDIGAFCGRIDPMAFRMALLCCNLVVNQVALDGAVLRRSPLSRPDEAALEPRFDAFLESLARLNMQLCSRPHPFVASEKIHLDLSTRAATDALVKQGCISLTFSDEVCAATAGLRVLSACEPWEAMMESDCAVHGNRVTIAIAEPCQVAGRILRRSLELQVRTSSMQPLQTFCCER
jgi:hypothetical protein